MLAGRRRTPPSACLAADEAVGVGAGDSPVRTSCSRCMRTSADDRSPAEQRGPPRGVNTKPLYYAEQGRLRPAQNSQAQKSPPGSPSQREAIPPQSSPCQSSRVVYGKRTPRSSRRGPYPVNGVPFGNQQLPGASVSAVLVYQNRGCTRWYPHAALITT